MELVRIRKISYAISLLLVAGAIAALFAYGLKLGIDFTGGSLIEVRYVSRPNMDAVSQKVEALGLGHVIVQPVGEDGFAIRTRELTTEERQRVLGELGTVGEVRDSNVNTIGPTIGRELRNRSIWAILLVITAIILYIAFAFRKVSEPVSSWFYGFFAIAALFHDILIPLGIFAWLGHAKGVEIDMLFVTAILTVLGFSVHDTIVVYDRIRENLKNAKKESFEEIVGASLSQTITRSVNTTLTVLIVLLALYFLGADGTKYFALALIIGIVAGTYSSIFVASPLLVTWNNYRQKKAGK